MTISKQDVMKAADSLQVCAGQENWCRSSNTRSSRDILNPTTEAVLLIDAESAFNTINRKAKLHNICHMSYYIYLHK